MWLYSNDLPKHVNEIMEYFDDTPEMLQFDVMSPREFKGAAFRKHINDDCFRKVNGKWKIVHQHVSFPIESMETGKADFQSKR